LADSVLQPRLALILSPSKDRTAWGPHPNQEDRMSDDLPTHERTVQYKDPTGLAKDAMRSDGLDFLSKLADGTYPQPPIAVVNGFRPDAVEPGRAVFKLGPGRQNCNPTGTGHGGVMATLIDSAASCAIHTTLPEGTAYTTVDLTVNFVRAVTADLGTLTCEGKIIHRGGRIGTAEARLTDANGKLYAHGTATCIIMPAPEGATGG